LRYIPEKNSLLEEAVADRVRKLFSLFIGRVVVVAVLEARGIEAVGV
jgi:hypothetical protein